MNLAKVSSKLFIAVILVISISVSVITSIYVNRYLDRYLQGLNMDLAFENRFVSSSRVLPGSYAESLEQLREMMNRSGAGLFEGLEIAESIEEFEISNLLASGVVLTADGWIMLSDYSDLNENNFLDYSIEVGGEIREIVQVLNDDSGIIFAKVNASGLRPIAFAKSVEFLKGDQVLLMDFEGRVEAVTILNRGIDNSVEIKRDYDFGNNWLLSNHNLSRAMAFDAAGQLVGFVNEDKELIPLHHLTQSMGSLLANGELVRAGLGIRIIDLTRISNLNLEDYPRLGALIVENGLIEDGPLAEAGLEVGDVITAVDGELISKDLNLAMILSGFMVGDEVRVTYVRNGIEDTIIVVLENVDNLIY